MKCSIKKIKHFYKRSRETASTRPGTCQSTLSGTLVPIFCFRCKLRVAICFPSWQNPFHNQNVWQTNGKVIACTEKDPLLVHSLPPTCKATRRPCRPTQNHKGPRLAYVVTPLRCVNVLLARETSDSRRTFVLIVALTNSLFSYLFSLTWQHLVPASPVPQSPDRCIHVK